MGLSMQAHQDRLMKKELSSGFSLCLTQSTSCGSIESAGWHCSATPLNMGITVTWMPFTWRKFHGVCHTPSGSLPNLCYSVATVWSKHPCCLSFIHVLSSFINIKSEWNILLQASSRCAIYNGVCQEWLEDKTVGEPVMQTDFFFLIVSLIVSFLDNSAPSVIAQKDRWPSHFCCKSVNKWKKKCDQSQFLWSPSMISGQGDLW